jgi:hypothetical protein
MKYMLHALRKLDYCKVLVLQNQMNITCGIVMHTRLQNMMFERWGQTLAMDFTHCTNNLVYHLCMLGLVYQPYHRATILIATLSSIEPL